MAAPPNYCLRSLGATLIAAASTSALFAAANRKLTFFMHNIGGANIAEPGGRRTTIRAGSLTSIVMYTVLCLASPLFPLFVSVTNAGQVGAVKRSLRVHHDRNVLEQEGGHNIDLHHGSIAITTLCPILIIFPAAARSELINGDTVLAGYHRITNLKEIEDDLCPMELPPAPSRLADPAAAPALATGNISNNIISTNGSADEGGPGEGAGADDQLDSTQLECWELPLNGSIASTERVALLRAGLAPKYNELRFLRSRNKFQSVVTAFQASGYMLTVLQRMAQHLEISPVEAITSCLCIVIGLQLLIELYASSHYQRPLLLRLTTPQLRRFLNVPRCRYSQDIPIPSPKSHHLIGFDLLVLLPLMVILAPCMYYFIHSFHASCLICSLSALFFFLSQMVLLIGIYILEAYSHELEVIRECLQFLIFMCSSGMCVCSIVLAVVATSVKWKAFHEATQQSWFAWLLPHVSG